MTDEAPAGNKAPSGEEDERLLPVRMLNEFVYCPRLFHFMHVEGRWEDNAFTVEGRTAHRRVDRFDDVLPDPAAPEQDAERPASSDAEGGEAPPEISRSVNLASHALGLIAKLDLVATAGDEAVPVETKRGRVPQNPERSYEPERVQLMAQGLLLREQGYRCDHGTLYFRGSRTRVDVPFTPELEARTLDWLARAHLAVRSTVLPPPLEDSPKCNGCSLNGICLPDETLALQHAACPGEGKEVRRLYPARDEAQPFYVQEQGAHVGKSQDTLVVRMRDEQAVRVRLLDVSQLVLCGNVQVSTQTLHLLCERGVPTVFLSTGGWFYGIASGIQLRNAYDRAAQFQAAQDPSRRLQFAKALITAKVQNQRTLLRRNADGLPDQPLDQLSAALNAIDLTSELDSLLGLEGHAAAVYFEHFTRMLRPKDLDIEWDFQSRNRRPPKDPVNALLSYAYALLAKELTVAALSEGLDPWWGLYHRPRHGRPSLALDLMEEFRPLLADSAVISAINTGMVGTRDFVRTKAGCAMKPEARKALIRAYEARMDQLVTHPLFDYRCTWRSITRMQARLLARWLRGDIPAYTGMTTR